MAKGWEVGGSGGWWEGYLSDSQVVVELSQSWRKSNAEESTIKAGIECSGERKKEEVGLLEIPRPVRRVTSKSQREIK